MSAHKGMGTRNESLELCATGQTSSPGQDNGSLADRSESLKELLRAADGRIACYEFIDCAWALVTQRIHDHGGHPAA